MGSSLTKKCINLVKTKEYHHSATDDRISVGGKSILSASSMISSGCTNTSTVEEEQVGCNSVPRAGDTFHEEKISSKRHFFSERGVKPMPVLSPNAASEDSTGYAIKQRTPIVEISSSSEEELIGYTKNTNLTPKLNLKQNSLHEKLSSPTIISSHRQRFDISSDESSSEDKIQYLSPMAMNRIGILDNFNSNCVKLKGVNTASHFHLTNLVELLSGIKIGKL